MKLRPNASGLADPKDLIYTQLLRCSDFPFTFIRVSETSLSVFLSFYPLALERADEKESEDDILTSQPPSREVAPRYLEIAEVKYGRAPNVKLIRDAVDNAIYYLQAGKKVLSLDFI